jgi:hypothetical protein
VKAIDEAQKPQVMQRHSNLLNQRYDLANRPIPSVMMTGRRKAVQGGVRVKLPEGVTWDSPGEHESRRDSAAKPAAGELPALATCPSRRPAARSSRSVRSRRFSVRRRVTYGAST